jgi:hypothetical protein
MFGRLARLALVGVVAASAMATFAPRTLGAEPAPVAAASAMAVDWSASIPMDSGWLIVSAVASDPDGVYLVGTTNGVATGESSAGWDDVVVARLDPDGGSPIWVTQFGTAEYERGFDIEVTPAGVYVGGLTNGSLQAGVPALADSPFVAQLTFDGSIAWVRQGPRRATPWRVAATPDGGTFVASTADVSTDPSRSAAQVRRYAPNGNLVWEREVTACCLSGTFGTVEVRSIASDPGGGLVVGGSSVGSITGGVDSRERGFIQLFTLNGQVQWTRQLEASWGAVSLTAVTVNHDGIVATGTSQGHLPDLPDNQAAGNPWYRRYDFDGHLESTLPMTRKTIAPDCSGVITTFDTTDAQSGLPGGALQRLNRHAASSWRFDRQPTATDYRVFHDVTRSGGKAFILEETGDYVTFDMHVTTVSGLPDPGGCDTEPPTARAPRPKIIVHSWLQDEVAARLVWSGNDDDSGVARFDVGRRVDGGAPTLVKQGLVSPALVVDLAPGHRYRYVVTAVDHAANADSARSPWFDVARRDDRSSAFRYTGRWGHESSADAAKGTLTSTTDVGATASFVVTGRSIAWVATRSRTGGMARVEVDGKVVGTVDLHLRHRQPQSIVWRKSWATSETHRVTIRVIDSKRDGRVNVDALVAID